MAEEKIQAGLFSDEVTLELGNLSVANDYGESTNSWITTGSRWVKIDYLSGSSNVKNDVEQRLQKIKLTGHYDDFKSTLLSGNETFLFRFKIYNIASTNVFSYYYITEVKPIGFRNREFVEIYCKGRY